MSWIIGTEDFNKNLNRWLDLNDQKAADFLHKNKNKIPPTFRSYTSKLYRGMTIPATLLQEISTKGITFKTHTSWSKDEKIARKFIDDPQYSLVKAKESSVKIVIVKTISSPSQIIDIDGFVMFMGIPQLEMQGFDELALDSANKEKEILISSGVRINKSDIKVL